MASHISYCFLISDIPRHLIDFSNHDFLLQLGRSLFHYLKSVEISLDLLLRWRDTLIANEMTKAPFLPLSHHQATHRELLDRPTLRCLGQYITYR